MALPDDSVGGSAQNAIDLTDDSDAVTGYEVKAVSPVSTMIKQEPGEGKGRVIDLETSAGEKDISHVQSGTEHFQPELTKPTDVEADAINKDPPTEHSKDVVETVAEPSSNLSGGVEQSDMTINETNQPAECTTIVQPYNKDDNVNHVDSLQDAPTLLLEDEHEIMPVAEPDPFSTNNVNHSFENIIFDPLPVFEAHEDSGPDINNFDALLQYNQNKPDFGEDDVVDGARDDALGAYDYLGDDVIEGSSEPLGLAVDDNANNSEPVGMVIDETGDVMDWEVLAEENAAAEDEMAAAAFAKRKKQYEKKVAEGSNTQEDDISFAAARADELQRLRDIERSQMEVEDPPEQTGSPDGDVEEESLFVPEVPDRPDPPPKNRAVPKPKNRLSKKDIDDALSAGINAGRGENRKPKRKARESGEEPQPKKRRQTDRPNGVKKPAQKRGRKRPNMSNIASLGRTNIVEAAQANADAPDMPTFTDKNKAKALKELIASIPSSERANATSDRTAVMNATKKFKGIGAVRSDGRGGWKLRGMASSLYNHQLLGAAFLRERETGDSKPKGGLVCDEMGFGKTIQMM